MRNHAGGTAVEQDIVNVAIERLMHAPVYKIQSEESYLAIRLLLGVMSCGGQAGDGSHTCDHNDGFITKETRDILKQCRTERPTEASARLPKYSGTIPVISFL